MCNSSLEINYSDPSARSEVGKWSDQEYERKRQSMQELLSSMSLTDALEWLFLQQIDAGFIKDDLSKVQNFRCYSDDDKHYFIGQFNSTRADRHLGAGRKNAPAGVQTKEALDLTCFLCKDNVRWQHLGVQLYYELCMADNDFVALCNPFPFMPVHATIVTREHEPQSWFDSDRMNPEEKIHWIVSSLHGLAKELPGFIGFYNGVGAGATIEKHLHFHFCKVPDGHDEFPIQRAVFESAEDYLGNGNPSLIPPLIQINADSYPIAGFRMHGEDAIENTVKIACNWRQLCEDAASANIIAMWEQDQMFLYFMPRNKFFTRAPGMQGMVGGCEVLGEFIFCTPDEERAINIQEINYKRMWSILRAVNPPKSDRLRIF